MRVTRFINLNYWFSDGCNGNSLPCLQILCTARAPYSSKFDSGPLMHHCPWWFSEMRKCTAAPNLYFTFCKSLQKYVCQPQPVGLSSHCPWESPGEPCKRTDDQPQPRPRESKPLGLGSQHQYFFIVLQKILVWNQGWKELVRSKHKLRQNLDVCSCHSGRRLKFGLQWPPCICDFTFCSCYHPRSTVVWKIKGKIPETNYL